MLGSTELIVVAIIIFLLFGAASIPKLAKSLGQAKNEFDKGIKSGLDESEKSDDSSSR